MNDTNNEKKREIKRLFNEEGYGSIRIINTLYPSVEHNIVALRIAIDEIYTVLGFSSFDDYHKAYTATHQRLRRESGCPEARKLALKRDNFQCRISSEKTSLEVHHIDGDYRNNALHNLITIHTRYHNAIHSYLSFIELHSLNFALVNEYIIELRRSGYPKAGMRTRKDKSHGIIDLNVGALPVDVYLRQMLHGTTYRPRHSKNYYSYLVKLIRGEVVPDKWMKHAVFYMRAGLCPYAANKFSCRLLCETNNCLQERMDTCPLHVDMSSSTR